jgi:hypothetical protein
VSVYGTSPIKRRRRTKAELEDLDRVLADIVAEIQPAPDERWRAWERVRLEWILEDRAA